MVKGSGLGEATVRKWAAAALWWHKYVISLNDFFFQKGYVIEVGFILFSVPYHPPFIRCRTQLAMRLQY